MLILENVGAGYDDAQVLHGISLFVKQGEVVAMIGANGAGKSTLMRTISGLVRARTGRITFEGEPITALTPDRIVARGLVHVPEGRRVFPELTVEENLLAAAYLVADRAEVKRRLEAAFTRFPRLAERRAQDAGTLSGGEQQMLAFGRAMMTGPKLVLLDEPTLGLAPRLVEDVAAAVRMFQGSGVTVFLVEQNARLALALADRAYVMDTGRLVRAGTARELAADPSVQASYLGKRVTHEAV